MNKYENGVIKYAIDFEAYKNGKADEIIDLLDKASSEISKFIKKTGGVYTKARYQEIRSKLKDVSKALKQNVGNGIDLDAVIDYELKKEKKLLDSVKSDIVKVKGGEVNFLYPTMEQVKTAALFKPVTEGFTYDSYLDGIEAGLYNTWDSAVRTGYLTGQTTQQIVRNVMGGVSPQAKLKEPGAINSLRNSVYRNTRTVLQSFANETRNRVMEENEQYFGDGKTDYKYEYLATLDNRTCLVCGDLDGKLYRKIEEAPSLPQHGGCRCLLIPYFDIVGGTRASNDGYVNSKMTYEEWLSEQDEKTQLDVLGKTRYEMYKQGKTINQFVDNGKIQTLKQLNNGVEPISIKSKLFENVYGNADNIKKAKEELLNFAENVSIPADTDIESVNTVTRRLEYLKSKYPTEKLKKISFSGEMPDTQGGSACCYTLSINKNIKIYAKGILQPAEWKKVCEDNLEKLKKLRENNEEKLKLAVSESSKKLLKKNIKCNDKEIKIWGEYAKYTRFNAKIKGLEIEGTVSHEYGHIIVDQKTGQINGRLANKNFEKKDGNPLYEKTKLIDNAFEKAKTTGDIYGVSVYGGTNAQEFFAECFSIYSMGKEKLPEYIVDMIKEVIK